MRMDKLQDCHCDRCGYGTEDANQVFVNCIWARSIWWQIAVWMRIPRTTNICSLKEVVKALTGNIGSARWKRVVYTVILATVWRIWNARNLKVFEGQFVPTRRTVDLIKENVFLWISHRTKLPKLDWNKWAEFNVSEIFWLPMSNTFLGFAESVIISSGHQTGHSLGGLKSRYVVAKLYNLYIRLHKINYACQGYRKICKAKAWMMQLHVVYHLQRKRKRLKHNTLMLDIKGP
ncbi:hypothetical protein HanOQP8_Chr13g0484001 [Helianthus annuus]|nr:hypothetical protein HanOQP8_Chr13g0484001 [Helianthus annuus]